MKFDSVPSATFCDSLRVLRALRGSIPHRMGGPPAHGDCNRLNHEGHEEHEEIINNQFKP